MKRNKANRKKTLAFKQGFTDGQKNFHYNKYAPQSKRWFDYEEGQSAAKEIENDQ